jgi:hypothetical protein
VSQFIYCYVECQYGECRYAECCGAPKKAPLFGLNLAGKSLTKGQYYKAFYGRNLRIFVISYSVCPWQAFPALQLWPGAYPRVEHLKQSNLLQKLIDCGRKKFYNVGPKAEVFI